MKVMIMRRFFVKENKLVIKRNVVKVLEIVGGYFVWLMK